MNTMPKYVVSSTLTDPQWNNTTVLERRSRRRRGGACASEVDGDIVVYGSGQLVQALLEADLVDEMRLLVYPVVVGDGARLFGPTSDLRRLRLAESRTFDDGVALLVYQRAA